MLDGWEEEVAAWSDIEIEAYEEENSVMILVHDILTIAELFADR